MLATDRSRVDFLSALCVKPNFLYNLYINWGYVLADSNYTTITTAQARRNLAEIFNRAAYGEERFIVTRHGRQIAGIVPINLIRRLMRMEELERMEGMLVQDALVEDIKNELGLTEEKS